MRLIGLLLSLAILGYVINIYLDSSVESSSDGERFSLQPQQTIEQAEDTARQLNQALQNQQEKLKEAE